MRTIDEALNAAVAVEPEPALPPVLYVPCEQSVPSGSDVVLELRQLTDGRLALLTYSALDRLVAACGDAQPWALIPTARLDEIAETVPYEVIALDLTLPADERRTAR